MRILRGMLSFSGLMLASALVLTGCTAGDESSEGSNARAVGQNLAPTERGDKGDRGTPDDRGEPGCEPQGPQDPGGHPFIEGEIRVKDPVPVQELFARAEKECHSQGLELVKFAALDQDPKAELASYAVYVCGPAGEGDPGKGGDEPQGPRDPGKGGDEPQGPRDPGKGGDEPQGPRDPGKGGDEPQGPRDPGRPSFIEGEIQSPIPLPVQLLEARAVDACAAQGLELIKFAILDRDPKAALASHAVYVCGPSQGEGPGKDPQDPGQHFFQGEIHTKAPVPVEVLFAQAAEACHSQKLEVLKFDALDRDPKGLFASHAVYLCGPASESPVSDDKDPIRK